MLTLAGAGWGPEQIAAELGVDVSVVSRFLFYLRLKEALDDFKTRRLPDA